MLMVISSSSGTIVLVPDKLLASVVTLYDVKQGIGILIAILRGGTNL